MAVTNASIPPVVVTSTTSTQNGIPVTNAAGTNVFTGNSDYAGPLGSLSTVQFRLVAAGLRVQYDGPLLNAGGRIVGVEEPDHRPLNGTTFTNLSQYDEARVMRIEPDTWYQVEYRPIDDSSLRYGAYSSGMHFLEGTSAGDVRVLSVDYDDSEFQEFVGDEDNANATMAFAILPAEPGDGGKFLFEAYAHFECIGRTVRGATPSHADIVGFSAVSNVTGQLGSRAPKMNPGSASDEVNQAIGRHTVGEATQTGNSIVSGLVGLARTAIPTALEIGASLLGGPIAGRAVGGVANAAMRQIAPAVTTSGGQRLLLGAASTM